jgi:hypothetical protein
MASQAHSGGDPRRLLFSNGQWILELVRHVQVAPDVVRPTTEELRGTRTISTYFKDNPSPQGLARGALELLQTTSLGTCSFAAADGEWVASPSLIPPPLPFEMTRTSGGSRLEDKLAALEARAVGLLVVQQGLLARLERLEQRFASEGGESADHARRAPAAADPPARGRAPGAAGGGSAARPDAAAAGGRPVHHEPAPASAEAVSNGSRQDLGADADHVPSSTRDAAARAPSAAPPAGPAAIAEPAPEGTPRQPLELPPAQELAKCIALLVGNNVSAREVDELPLGKSTPDCYSAPLLDDAGKEIGLIVMDIKATIYLGGTLMMMPSARLDQQVRSLSPEEDSVAASAEVCNALTGPINDAQSRFHVRVGNFGKFEFKASGWVTAPSDRRDLEDSFGGRTTVLARP